MRVPAPLFFTVKVRSFEVPTMTVPKLSEDGVTAITGAAPPVPVTGGETLPPLDVKATVRVTLPVTVGEKRTMTSWLAPGPRLKDAPEAML